MADKQLLMKHKAEDGFFADDDPLAALALIGSFDPQGETRPRPVNQRREPEFNLEDELLKEFEQYEEPASSAPLLGSPVDARVIAPEPVFAAEPYFADEVIESAPVVEPEPVREFHELRAVPQPKFEAPVSPVRPVSHPVFDLEDEILKEFAAFDAKRTVPEPPVAKIPAIEPVAAKPVPAVAPEIKPVVAPVVQAPAAPIAMAPVPQAVYSHVEPSFDDTHHADIVETHAAYSGYGDDHPSIEAEVVPESAALDIPALDAMESEVDPAHWHDLHEAIFQAEEPVAHVTDQKLIEAPAHVKVEPVGEKAWQEQPVAVTPVVVEEKRAIPSFEQYRQPVVAAPADAVVTVPVKDVPAPAAVRVSAPSVVQPVVAPVVAQPRKDDFGLDALLADVERYPVATPVRRANPVAEQQVIAPVERAAVPVQKPAEQAAAPVVEVIAPIIEARTMPVVEPVVTPKIEPVVIAPKVEPVAFTPKAIEPVYTPKIEPVVIVPKVEPVAFTPKAIEPVYTPKVEPVVVAPKVEAVVAPRTEPVAVAPKVETVAIAPKVEPVVIAPKIEPIALAPKVESIIVAPKGEPAAFKPKVESHKAATAASHVHEAFDDGAFELDLSEIELDMLEMEVESLVAPAQHEDQIVASSAALADMAKTHVEERPLYAERANIAIPRPAEDYSSLPFDPSQVTSEEDPLEALADMDVPETPVVDHGISVPAQPDYDIDIDAEMAHIFSPAADTAPRRNGQQAKPGQQSTQTAPLTSADLDEFERALEEDFRRSLSENRVTSTPDRVALTPVTYDDGGRQSSLGKRLTILAASVAGLVLIGGAAVYAYWGNPGKMLMTTSSEPKIILADKDPVKIQPKDRGGQLVPNQDKAVYDRVSGDDKDIAKQERLVTSNEEPVDVVQKTLMPENLPLDDEDQASATDVADTTDSRLLPEQQDKNITTTEKVVSGVSPRKVRTMVVRSDGTLVPRDETDVPAETKTDTKTLTPAETLQERSLDVAPDVSDKETTPDASENVPERLAANDDVAKEIQQASADTKSFVPEVKKPADVVDTKPVQTDDNTQVADTQPVTEDQPVVVKTEEKPVIAADDNAKSDDTAAVKKQDLAPVTNDTADVATTDTTADNTVADKTKVEDTTKAEDTSADTTAATDNAKPVDQTAIDAAANANVEETAPVRTVKTTKIISNTPIPENRPVDQPVDIVGTVNDQGEVQKNQEVAEANPVRQVQNTTTTTTSGYVIQIASLPSAAEAQNSYSKLSAKFANVIGGHGVDIRKASIKNKGTYYRVRIPAGTRQEATDLCSRYKAAGGSCLVSK